MTLGGYVYLKKSAILVLSFLFVSICLPAALGAQETISGVITPSSVSSGATVALRARYSGNLVASTSVNSNGTYSFANIASGRYRVIPTKANVTFSPTSRGVHVYSSPITGVDFTATATSSTYSISGTIAGGAGATIALSGTQSGSTTADSSGNFSFSGLTNGSYSLTPSKSGFTFSPATQAVTVNGANVAGISFTASATQPPPAYSISGTITPSSNGAGATVALSGTATATATADANGNYSFTGLGNGNYTVTPSKSGFTFSPVNQSATINGANVGGLNFTSVTSNSSHSVDLNWNASTTSTVSGYKVYRSSTSGGPYAAINSAPVTSTLYTDLNVAAGATYYYVVTAVDSAGNESSYSNQVVATIPSP